MWSRPLFARVKLIISPARQERVSRLGLWERGREREKERKEEEEEEEGGGQEGREATPGVEFWILLSLPLFPSLLPIRDVTKPVSCSFPIRLLSLPSWTLSGRVRSFTFIPTEPLRHFRLLQGSSAHTPDSFSLDWLSRLSVCVYMRFKEAACRPRWWTSYKAGRTKGSPLPRTLLSARVCLFLVPQKGKNITRTSLIIQSKYTCS